DVVLVGDREALRVGDLVAHRDEDQRAAAAFLHAHVADGGFADRARAHREGPHELEAAAGPHAPRQRHRGKEPAAPRMAVGAELRLPVRVEEVEPVRERRYRFAFARLGIVAVEERAQLAQRPRADRILALLEATDPARKRREVLRLRHGVVSHVPPSARMSATLAARRRSSTFTTDRSSASWLACTTVTLR